MKSVWMLLGQPVFQALGWALVHFIWQGALVALLFAGVTALLRERAAGVRYLTGCAAMLLMLALPVTTAWLIGFSAEGLRTAEQQSGQGSAVGSRLRKTVVAANERVTSPGAVNADEVLPPEAAPLQRWAGEQFASFMPWLVLAWLAGALGLSLRFLGGWLAARRLVLRQTRPLAREWQERSARLARRLNVCGAVRLCESVLTEVPTVIGWVRPVILVPASILTGLSAEQVEALLAHELAHVRRYDYLVNLLQTAVETLLFYHPAVWWVSRRVRVEREHCCDDLAVAACGDVLAYAHALTRLEQLRASCPEPLLMAASGGGSLLQRIRRLIEASPSSSKNSSPLLACLILLLGAGGLFAGARGALLSTGTVAGGVRASSAAESARREVAITFYSVPYMRSQRDDDQTVESTTRKLLKGITSNRIPAVGFVGEKGLYVGDRPEPRTSALKMWLDAGLELGNQTFSHRWLYHTPLEDYERDVVRGEAVTGNLLRERGRGLRYFLYPYLNTGPDLETKAAFEKFLAARGYTFAPVTIDNMDWLFAQVYDEARQRGDAEGMQRVAREYVPYMERMFEFYETLSVDVVGYEVPQVLMLTASALNADHFEELAAMLKRRGYSFIALEQALKDKAYQLPDKYTGPVGISWLQRWAITKGLGFRKEPYLPAYMQQFDKRSGSRSDFKTNLN